MSTRGKQLALVLILFVGLLGSFGTLSSALTRPANAGDRPAAVGDQRQPAKRRAEEARSEDGRVGTTRAHTDREAPVFGVSCPAIAPGRKLRREGLTLSVSPSRESVSGGPEAGEFRVWRRSG